MLSQHTMRSRQGAVSREMSTSRFNKNDHTSNHFAKSEAGLGSNPSSNKVKSMMGESYAERIMSINSASVQSLLDSMNCKENLGEHFAKIDLGDDSPRIDT